MSKKNESPVTVRKGRQPVVISETPVEAAHKTDVATILNQLEPSLRQTHSETRKLLPITTGRGVRKFHNVLDNCQELIEQAWDAFIANLPEGDIPEVQDQEIMRFRVNLEDISSFCDYKTETICPCCVDRDPDMVNVKVELATATFDFLLTTLKNQVERLNTVGLS